MTTLAHEHPTAETADGSDVHAGYVSVAEITIDAPPSVVWPHVLEIGSWIRDIHFEHVSGTRNTPGEVKHLWPVDIEVVNGTASVAEKDRTSANAMVLKTLAVIPEKLWYGVNTPQMENDSIRSTGVNLLLLSEKGGKTLVTAIRSKESMCPSVESSRAAQDNMMKYQPMAQARWTNNYLLRLQELAENSMVQK